MANRWGNNRNSDGLLFSWAPKSLQMVTVAIKLKRHLLLGRKAMTNLDIILKSRDMTLSIKVHLIKAMVFLIVTYGCESWTKGWELKNWCFWTVVLEKILESPLDCKEIKQVNPGNQSIKEFNPEHSSEGLMLKLKIQYFGHLMERAGLIRKDPDAGKDWGQEEKGMTEDEMVGWHHWLNGDEFEQAPGDGEGQGSLACCSSWGRKKSDMTEQLNNNKQPLG